MHLLYVDESGKSGIFDRSQPFYVLGGLVVHETDWQGIERALNARIDDLVPPPRADDWELHMSLLYHAKGQFKGMPPETRFALVDAAFDVIEAHGAKLIFVGIDKQAHYRRYSAPEPVESLAYRFMIERFNSYVRRQEDQVGLVVCDEQKQLEAPTRREHSRYRRTGTGVDVIDRVIETPFFTPSHWSRMLQIVDVVTFYVARHLRGTSTGPYWPRIERLLDGYPHYEGKGLKRFPSN